MASRKQQRRPAQRGGARKAATPTPGLPTLVYVHGIGPQPSLPELLAEWNLALFGRDPLLPTLMAYWADLRPSAPAGPGARAAAYGERVARELGGAAPGPRRRRGPGKSVFPLPAFLREPITRALTGLFLEDTSAYFFDPKRRDAMRARVRDALRSVSGDVVLVAHSQGSIIAYDVLSELGEAVSVSCFITLGSALGLGEVQDQIAKPLRVPAGVRAWLNFVDVFDPIALDKGLANDFAPKGAIRDRRVAHRGRASFDFHGATGYLATDEVRAAVGRAVGERDLLELGRTVRKDVLAAMRDRVSRHPVLVELNDEKAFAGHFLGTAVAPLDLGARREQVRGALERLVRRSGADPVAEARIDPLQRFVAAHLTAAEIETVVREQRAHVYCIWKSSRKRKLILRSTDVIHAPPARIAYRASGRAITWAVLDTGVQADHAHFAKHGTLTEVFDCTRPGEPKELERATDPDGHGTHVAAIIAGEGSADRKTYSGVAPEARLRVYKVLDDDGSGEDAWIIKALDHIAASNAAAPAPVVHGVNLSLGGPFDPEVYGCGHSPICQELQRLWRTGVLVCVACGNEGQIEVETPEGVVDLNTALSVGDPANLEECIAVGSVHADKPHLYGISYFSSRGPTADGRAKPDVVAPGERIASADAESKTGYVAMSGTSMACPHVSGLLAAFLSARPEFVGRPDEVKRRLLASCTDLGRDRYHQGAGIPNLLKMLGET
jgi:hypothetical protein